MGFDSPEFWVAVIQIIAIDIILGGDNAIVIALACRHLPEKQRNLGIFWGVLGAITLRVLLIFFALSLLSMPYLKISGAALLIWIGIKLLQPVSNNEEHGVVTSSTTLIGAIKTIIVADAVMSLDNVIAIAGAARDSLGLVVFGLVISVPIIVWGSQLVMKLMDRYPVTIVMGAALLGWIAGDMVVTDEVTRDWIRNNAVYLQLVIPTVTLFMVVIIGKKLAQLKNKAAVVVDLANKAK